MSRSARQPERKGANRPKRGGSAPRSENSAFAAFVMRNPLPIAGGTAFVVAMSFVSANALWYQPHRHPGAFFATRTLPPVTRSTVEAETTFRLEDEEASTTRLSDPVVFQVQDRLKELGIYAGPVEGLVGKATRRAVLVFQAENGLQPSGEIDDALLKALRLPSVESTTPPERTGSIGPATASGDPDIRKIQAGLRAFGNEAITVDGVAGSRTEAGIREFQKMFGLPETGKPDAAVMAKMQEIGLIH